MHPLASLSIQEKSLGETFGKDQSLRLAPDPSFSRYPAQFLPSSSTLRACFATQLISTGSPPAIVMKICGWKDLKTMQRYIRLAGIDESGATEGLKFLPTTDAAMMEKVVSLFGDRGGGQ